MDAWPLVTDFYRMMERASACSNGSAVGISEALCCHFKIFFKCLFLRERERETEHEMGRGRERGRHGIGSSSRLRAVSTEPDAGPEPTNCKLMT